MLKLASFLTIVMSTVVVSTAFANALPMVTTGGGALVVVNPGVSPVPVAPVDTSSALRMVKTDPSVSAPMAAPSSVANYENYAAQAGQVANVVETEVAKSPALSVINKLQSGADIDIKMVQEVGDVVNSSTLLDRAEKRALRNELSALADNGSDQAAVRAKITGILERAMDSAFINEMSLATAQAIKDGKAPSFTDAFYNPNPMQAAVKEKFLALQIEVSLGGELTPARQAYAVDVLVDAVNSGILKADLSDVIDSCKTVPGVSASLARLATAAIR